MIGLRLLLHHRSTWTDGIKAQAKTSPHETSGQTAAYLMADQRLG
jgi:hypothetical protein